MAGGFRGAMSDFGLASEGIDTARGVRQNYDINAQNMDIQRQRMALDAASQEQARRQREQTIKLGDMGLEDAGRVRADQAAERAAVASGGGDMGATLDAVRGQRVRAGNLGGVQEVDQQRMHLEMAAITQLARDAASGVDPKQAEANLRRYGLGTDQVEGSLKFSKDTNGDDLVNMTGKDGTPRTMNLTAFTRQISKPEVHSIGAAGSIITGPGRKTEVINPIVNHPSKGWEMGTTEVNGRKYTLAFNKDTSEAHLLNEDGSPVAGGEKMTVHSAGDQTYVSVGGQLYTVNPGTPGSPAKPGGWFSSDKPAVPPTPSSLQPVQLPENPPVSGAVRFTFPQGHPRAGETIWVKKGDDGKPYEVRTSGNQAPPRAATPAPAAAPAPMPAATPPAAPPVAPAPTEAAAPPVEQPKPTPETAMVKATSGRNKPFPFDEAMERSDPRLKMLGNSLRLGIGNPNLEVQMRIEYLDRVAKLKKT